jgi:hypothetical protein
MNKTNLISKIMDVLNEIDYGFKDKNDFNILNDVQKWDTEFYKFYYLLSPEELLEKKCGVCWDQVELERKLFEDYKIDYKTYFIYIDDKKNLPSHTFLTFNYNNKIYWLEHSWYDYRGIREYNNLNDLLDDLISKFIKSRENEIDGNYDILIYQYNKPKYHISCDEFYEYIKTQNLIRKTLIIKTR